MGLFFAFMTSVLTAVMIIWALVLIIKAAAKKDERRTERIRLMLDHGVYDPKLLYRSRRGMASLGWGIVFVTIGIGMLIGFINLGLLAQGAMGTAIVTLFGVGLITFYFVRRALTAKDGSGSDKPIVLPGASPAPGSPDRGDDADA